MQIGNAGTPVSHISRGVHRSRRGAGTGLVRRSDGPGELHRVLPPAAYRPATDRGAAILPRPAAGGDRRARNDADERGRADDARCRSRIAPGRRRCRASSAADRCMLGTSEQCAVLLEQAQRDVASGRPPESVAQSMRAFDPCRGDRARASAIRCIDRSIPAPSGSSSSLTLAGSADRTCCSRGAFAMRWPRPGAGR